MTKKVANKIGRGKYCVLTTKSGAPIIPTKLIETLIGPCIGGYNELVDTVATTQKDGTSTITLTRKVWNSLRENREIYGDPSTLFFAACQFLPRKEARELDKLWDYSYHQWAVNPNNEYYDFGDKSAYEIKQLTEEENTYFKPLFDALYKSLREYLPSTPFTARQFAGDPEYSDCDEDGFSLDYVETSALISKRIKEFKKVHG